MNPKRKNLIQLNVAVVLWGITALFAKTIPLPVVHIIVGRSVVAALALLVFLRVTRQPFRIEKRADLPVLGMLGILLAVHWVTYFHSIRVSTVAVAIISLHTYPIITILLEPWFFGERLRLSDVLMGVVVFAGILILIPEFDVSSEVTQGVLWGLVSAVFFAFRNILTRKSIRTYSGSMLMFVQVVVTAAVLLPFTRLGGASYGGNALLQLAVLGVFFTALPQTLFTASFANLKAKTVSIIATLLPIYGAVFAALVLGEIPSVRTVVGGSIVLCAVAYETARSMK